MTDTNTTKPLRILVTGGAGFIGSALVRHLIRETPHTVLNLDKLTYAGNLSSLEPIANSPRYAFRQLDICDQPGIAAAIAEFKPDVITHLAAESHVDRSIDGPGEFIETNVTGTFSMLQGALGYWRSLDDAGKAGFRFHHISTDEVFGTLADDGYFTEETPYDPHSPYSASKAASDHLVRAWHDTYGLPTIITNCSNNYGPYHFPEKLIPLMILTALDGGTLPVYGKGLNVRDWLYVEDHARALTTVFEQGAIGQSYIIGGRAERTNITVVHAICETLDKVRPRSDGKSYKEKIGYVTDRPGHDHRYAIDPSKLERELGWKARESFESGIERTVKWYLDNESWWQPLVQAQATARAGLKG